MRRRERAEQDRRPTAPHDRLHDRRTVLGRSAAGALAAIAGTSISRPRPVGAAVGGYPVGGFVDVRTFGAAGDGVTDDTAAIQAAVDALRSEGRLGGGITFPPGDYLVTDSIRIDYGTTLQGVNAALSRLVMAPHSLHDLVLGAGGFPVYGLLRDLTLDGGLESLRAADVPTGSGTCRVIGPLESGMPVDEVEVHAATCPIGPGDVLRTEGQPPIVVIGDRELAIGDSARVGIAAWAPATSIAGDAERWQVYRTGSLVRGVGRLTVERCLLTRAKRHAIELTGSTQGNVSSCEIGANQGAGLFGWRSSDSSFTRTWTYRNGGPDVFLFASADVRVSDCILEGSASTSVTAYASDVDVRSTGIWGGRTGLIRARQSDTVCVTGLKLRSPGYGKPDDDSFAAPGFRPVSGVPAIDVHFHESACGLQASQLFLRESLPSTGPIVWIRNGSRSSVAQVEWAPGTTFAGGHPAGAVVRDEGTNTMITACRGVTPVNAEQHEGEQRAKDDELP